ncbi:hypothetical protein [Brevibacterium moorei]|uniref:hypothetical protein n=1 Tax=Brevibacterium moorei TaxID=2968457 RepID=UPI00211BFCB9|nr:hypothetical protein [Brevibacterium sp. 68QC2CO]MCQ9385732.1 hypothetical protein [Brevibacterium sp. 68QC2CO]
MEFDLDGHPEAQLLALALQLTEPDAREDAGYRAVEVRMLRDFIGFALPSVQSSDDGPGGAAGDGPGGEAGSACDGAAGDGDAVEVHHVFPYGVRFRLLRALDTLDARDKSGAARAEPSGDPDSPWYQALAGLRDDVAGAAAEDRARCERALTYASALDDALSGASTREDFLRWLRSRADRLGRVYGSRGFAIAARHVDAFLAGNGHPD